MVKNVSIGRAETADCEINRFSNKYNGSVLSNLSTSSVSSIGKTYCHVICILSLRFPIPIIVGRRGGKKTQVYRTEGLSEYGAID